VQQEIMDATEAMATAGERVARRPLVEPRSLPDDLPTILAGIAAGVTVQDERGRLLFVNEDAARLSGFGSPTEMLEATPNELLDRLELIDEDGGPFERSRLPGRRALAGESVEPVLVGFRHVAGGPDRWSMILARRATLSDGRIVAINTFHDVTPRIEAEHRIRDSERSTQELAEARRRAEEIARMLADAALRLDEAEDVASVVQAAAEAPIPVLADWCVVDLLEPDGTVRRGALAARDAALEARVEPLRDHPGVADPARASRQAIASGNPVVVLDVTSWWATESPPDPDLRRLLEATGIRSAIAQPLTARGEVVGSIVFATVGERTFDPEGIVASQEIAMRVGLAIGNVRSYEAEQRARRAAEELAERMERLQAVSRTLAAAEHARAAELNAVIRAMGDGLVVCDRGGRIILANPAAEDVFPEVDETTYDEILAQLDDPDDLAPPLGGRGGPVALRVRSEDERWIEISTWPVAAGRDREADHDDETIVFLRDVTEQRQQQAVRDTFIGVLSHELRTPVTTIYAGAKVLSRPGQLAEDTRQEIFDDIVVESERLHRLVEDVVAMTRFGDEGGDVGAEPVLLQRLLPSVVSSEDGRWPGVTFAIDVPPGLPTVFADPTYVEQVVRNLLSNAAKYGGPGASVTARLEATDDEVLVRIIDDGPGFPADESERLFELFFRSSRTARAAAGAGIGLFVCARLIRAMGGRIWATTRAEGGAEFGFALRVMGEDG
jgi:signal transduction histidine kinase